jgi:hypothetical protein
MTPTAAACIRTGLSGGITAAKVSPKKIRQYGFDRFSSSPLRNA